MAVQAGLRGGRVLEDAGDPHPLDVRPGSGQADADPGDLALVGVGRGEGSGV